LITVDRLTACVCLGVECIEGGQVAGHSQYSIPLFTHRRLSRHRSTGMAQFTYLQTQGCSVTLII